jgi:hypothetical protein
LPAQWERKGAEYFSTGSIEARPEQIRTFRALMLKLRKMDGHLFYYGDEKQRGTLKQTNRPSAEIMHDALRETINRICTYAESRNDDVLIIADSFTDKTRQELAARMYAHIYTRPQPEMKRIVEAPLHIESKLNSGIQLADWICALLSRASHYQLVAGSEFAWSSTLFRESLSGMFTNESKLHLLYGPEIHHIDILRASSHRQAPMHPATIGGRLPNFNAIYEAAQRRKTT